MSIRFSPCIPSPCDPFATTGFAWRGTVVYPEGCTRIRCFALADIVTEAGDNNLTPLDCLRGRIGVYIVLEGDTALYVGSSTTVTVHWDLRQRIAQHFRKGDSGGTLRKNWERRHPSRDFTQFLRRMRCCCLHVVSVGTNASEQEVLRLEHLLIGLLGPPYCDVPKPTPRSADP